MHGTASHCLLSFGYRPQMLILVPMESWCTAWNPVSPICEWHHALNCDVTLEQTPSKGACWSDSTDNLQMHPFVSFWWWFYQYVCNRNIFWVIQIWAPRAQPHWLALSPKGWITITSAIHADWPCWWHHRLDQNGSTHSVAVIFRCWFLTNLQAIR